MGGRRLGLIGTFLLTLGTVPFAMLTRSTPYSYIVCEYTILMIGVAVVTMPITAASSVDLTGLQLSHGTAVNSTMRQVTTSMGTAVLGSVLTNVMHQSTPAHSLLASAPLVYQNQSYQAAMNGFHAAFLVATAFGILDFIFACFIKNHSREMAA